MKFKKFIRHIRNYNYLPLFLMLVLSITIHTSYAQNNNGIFFQAVARDNYSNPAKDRKIYVQSSIIQTTPSGVKVLIEEHQANTDAMGVFSISIGNGQRVGGTSTSITTIDWSKGPYYLNLKVAITPIGGNSSWDYTKEWIDMGTTSFGAVPFALYSASAAKVDDKLNISDTTKMLSVYAKTLSVKTLETEVASKLTAADTLNMLKPYAKAAYTIDSNYFKIQLATKLSLADSTKTYVTPTQLAAKTFDTTSLSNRINSKAVASDVTTSLNTKLNISDSTTSYVTPTQLAAKTFDTISLSNRIDLKSSSNEVVSSLNQKANATDVNSALSLKANASDLTAGLALKLDASKMGIANGVATLNGSGIIPSSQLPPVTLSSTNVVASDADMIALSSATVGSIAIRTDVNKNYVLSALPASTLGNWVELLTPAAPVQTVNGYTGVVSISKSDIGLGNVDNTTDAAKPVSTATQAALDLKLDASKVGVASGVASLNALGKIPTDQIPAISFSSVKVLSSDAEMLALSSAVVGSVVIRTDLNKNYVLAAANPSVLSNWIQLLTPAPPVQTVNGYTGNVTISKADLGLSDVNNTSDANKPISIATQAGLDAKANSADMTTALNLKSPLASPTFTGTVSIGTTHPSSSAALDISSTTQGLLLPRLTYLQKNAISSPEAGLLIWCSDCGTNGEMQVYNGTSFVNMIGNAAQFALPTINSTTTASSITSSAATSGGVISSDGGASITTRGVVWGTSTAPTIALATKTTDGTGVGTYTSSITGLTSGTTYYVRAYATNSVGTRYGSEISFNTSAAVATLATTTAASSIGATTAVSGGNITYNGGATVTVSGIVWSTSSTPTTALATKTTNGSATGTYTSSITGLTPGTLYYVRSYATNSVGTSYGAQTSFTTLNTATISATASVTSITSSTATSGGTITSDGGATVTSRGLVWGTSSGASTYSVTSGTGTGTFTSSLTGLSPATTYYVRSFATNSIGTSYGAETSFTSLAIAPTVSATATVTSITGSTATSGGTITSDGGATVTSRGLVWGTTTGSSTYSVTSGSGTGTFTSSLTGLSPATTYYVRSFATNSVGTVYGAEVSFTTATTATLSSTISSTITSSTAILGGVLSSTGGATTTIGIRYSTDINFGTYSTTIINANASAGTYTTTITGLSSLTTYYAKAYATNTVGTTLADAISFSTPAPPITVGSSYGGGIVFYILQSGDNGYDPNVQHGLIATTSDQSVGNAPWSKNTTFIGGTSLSIGSGSANTTRIITSQGNSGTYAAKIARDFVSNGYSDWYLPSHDEMKKLIAQRATVGGFGSNTYYWTSSECTTNPGQSDFVTYANTAWIQLNPSTGSIPVPNEAGKTYTNTAVRPIRSF